MRLLSLFLVLFLSSTLFGQITSGTFEVESKTVIDKDGKSYENKTLASTNVHFTPDTYIVERYGKSWWNKTFYKNDSITQYVNVKYEAPKIFKTTQDQLRASPLISLGNSDLLTPSYQFTSYKNETKKIAGVTCYKVIVDIEYPDFPFFDEEPFPGANVLLENGRATKIIAYVTDEVKLPADISINFDNIPWPAFPFYIERVSKNQRQVTQITSFNDAVSDYHLEVPTEDFEQLHQKVTYTNGMTGSYGGIDLMPSL